MSLFFEITKFNRTENTVLGAETQIIYVIKI